MEINIKLNSNLLVFIMTNLIEYNNCLTNVSNVIESAFNQDSLNFEKKVEGFFYFSVLSIHFYVGKIIFLISKIMLSLFLIINRILTKRIWYMNNY